MAGDKPIHNANATDQCPCALRTVSRPPGARATCGTGVHPVLAARTGKKHRTNLRWVGTLLEIAFFLLFALVPSVRADWQFRRQIDANWEPGQSPPTSLAVADFYTAGHSKADGSDICMTTEDGTFVASHVLMMGPGDRARVVFSLKRPIKKYFAYFGDPVPARPQPGPGDLKFDCGLHLEMKQLDYAGPLNNFNRLADAWDRGGKVIGETLIPEAAIGFNPFGAEDRTVSRISGSVFAPVDGQYVVSLWADNFAALFLDGKPVVYAAIGPADTRNHGSITLSRGPHDLLIYHVNTGADGLFLAAWKTPNSHIFQRIGRQEIAPFHTSVAEPLQENRQPLTADFLSQYMGETFFAGDYSYHYKFTAHEYGSGAEYDWDFGDGQTASGLMVDHVYLTLGIYSVKVTVQSGILADSQTTEFGVGRLWEQIDHPPAEPVAVHANIAARDDFSKLPEQSLCRAVYLFQRAGMIDPMLAAASRLASLQTHENVDRAFGALDEATREGIAAGRSDAVVHCWESVPERSNLHDRATMELAELLVWRIGDFAAADRLLQPLARGGDVRIKRIDAQALILDQKADEGAKLLASLPLSAQWEHHVALSGAFARTIEYYVTEKDWAAGEAAWEQWQAAFPADFLGGYSVLLRTRLMEIKGDTGAAAKVAEAFASAVPSSSYAPQLLDRASRLLASTDPAKSLALHRRLKEKYPEDPLSQ